MINRPVVKIVSFVARLFAGLFAGFLSGVLVLELSLRKFDGSVYTQVRLVELDRLDTFASVLLPVALMATAVLVIVAFRAADRARWLLVAALVLLVIAFTTSALFNVPINAMQAGWDVQAPPADWAGQRDIWQLAHVVRTGAALLAFACLAAVGVGKPAIPRQSEENRPMVAFGSH